MNQKITDITITQGKKNKKTNITLNAKDLGKTKHTNNWRT